jgi:transcriptional regulator with XRE-family HTH domain
MKLAERGYVVGDRVRHLRRARAITQQDLAELSGVHNVTISELECGRKASARTVRKLAAALDVDVKDLIDSRLPLNPPNELD